MKEFIDKLIERLEEEISWYETHGCNEDLKRGIIGANSHAIDLVNNLAEEYNGSWIPCSERLPEETGLYVVTHVHPLKDFMKYTLLPGNHYHNHIRRYKCTKMKNTKSNLFVMIVK